MGGTFQDARPLPTWDIMLPSGTKGWGRRRTGALARARFWACGAEGFARWGWRCSFWSTTCSWKRDIPGRREQPWADWGVLVRSHTPQAGAAQNNRVRDNRGRWCAGWRASGASASFELGWADHQVRHISWKRFESRIARKSVEIFNTSIFSHLTKIVLSLVSRNLGVFKILCLQIYKYNKHVLKFEFNEF